jgi:hypothetical protein
MATNPSASRRPTGLFITPASLATVPRLLRLVCAEVSFGSKVVMSCQGVRKVDAPELKPMHSHANRPNARFGFQAAAFTSMAADFNSEMG